MRVKAVIAYDGSAFYGFQSQTTTPKTVSGALARAAAKLGIHTPILGSGRTDRGVHATGQVIHFDLPPHWRKDPEKLRVMFNRLLKPHIHIKHIAQVHDGFHARFDAKRRIYRYVLKRTEPTPFEMPYTLHVPDIDTKRLAEALRRFEGTRDFALFHKKGSDPGSTVRTIFSTRVETFRNYTLLYLEADGFLRSQVRMITAAALQAMRGELTLEQIEEQLEGKEQHTTLLAEPQGLYLARVIY
ncbi:tRNA pseudouridine(38-40) synthase TruA [Hydrogenimonas sp.]|uniref:tRNA pseudouridine(38-40) synthase TruA n=1 Tax=Hydrogenimonas sp. TaxID=2231112 RepID=UPI00260892C5|nr:tRNA pseudouridine(38-40) synthase TruA [Hydrogenimonas sp.]